MAIRRHRLVAIAAAGALSVSLAACSTGEGVGLGPGTSGGYVEPETEEVAPESELVLITGGDSTLSLDAGVVNALLTSGVLVGVADEATSTDGAITLPITSGEVRTEAGEEGEGHSATAVTTYTGSLRHAGALTFQTTTTLVRLDNLTLDLGNARVLADVDVDGGELEATQIPVFRFDAATSIIDQPENGVLEADGLELVLDPVAASTLDLLTGTQAFEPDTAIGFLSSFVPVP